MDNYPYRRITDKEAFVMHTLVGHGELHALGFTRLKRSPISRGSIYYVLRRMEARGLVESRLDGAGKNPGRTRRIYRHTGLGVESMAVWDAMELAAETLTLGQAARRLNEAIHLTNTIVRDAILAGAREIRLSPRAGTGIVKVRLQRRLVERWRVPTPSLALVTTRLKLLAKLDTGIRAGPQEGRSNVIIQGVPYALRTSVVPLAEGERCIVRIASDADEAEAS